MQGSRVRPLVRELRSRVPRGQKIIIVIKSKQINIRDEVSSFPFLRIFTLFYFNGKFFLLSLKYMSLPNSSDGS